MNRRIWLVIALIVLLLMAAGCGGDRPETTPTPKPDPPAEPKAEATSTPEPTPVPEPSPTSVTALKILQRSIDSQESLGSYHFELTMDLDVIEDGVTTEMPFNFTGDYLAPDQTQAHMTLSILGDVLESDLVTVGGETYMTNPSSGRWETASTEDFLLPGSEASFLNNFIVNPERIRELTMVGQEELSGHTVYKLAGTIDVSDLYGQEVGFTGEFTINYWIDTQDYQIWKITNEGKMLAEGLDGEIDAKMEMVLSAFNEPVSIEMPVLDAPPLSLVAYCQANPTHCISKGADDAPVTLIEVSDYGCSHCRNFNLSTAELIESSFVDTGQVRYLVIPFALWPETEPVVVAAVCANEQDLFWEFHRLLFEMQTGPLAFTEEWYMTAALELELDMTVFEACLQDGAVQEMVGQNIAAVRSAEVNATPTFFVGEQKLEGNYPYADFAAVIATALEG